MFWGLIMEPGRCYTQSVKVSFHVSMAALDRFGASDEPVQVMCAFEGRNYLLCTLDKDNALQCPLDLNFETGSKVSFATNGKSHVHLTGYLIGGDDDLEDEEAEVEEKAVETRNKKRLKKAASESPLAKKLKVAVSNEEKEEVEAESSDSDFDIDKLMEADDDSEEGSEEEDEGDEQEDDEDEVDEEASSLSEEELADEGPAVKTKQNGISKAAPVPLKKTKQEKNKDQSKKEKQQGKVSDVKKTFLKGGVIVQDIKEGGGELVKPGKFVHVYYEGRLKDNNKVFDATTKGPGFGFRLGKGEVIKGWDIGLLGMKVGGKRRITCPPNTAYGQKGSPPVIPPNSTLVFEVEVKKTS